MFRHPPITGRRELQGEAFDIYTQMMEMLVRLDFLGERNAAAALVATIETLVDAPSCRETPSTDYHRGMGALDDYRDNLRDNDFGRP